MPWDGTTSFSACTAQTHSFAMENEPEPSIEGEIKIEIGIIKEEAIDPLSQEHAADIATSSPTSQSIKPVVKKECENELSDDSLRSCNDKIVTKTFTCDKCNYSSGYCGNMNRHKMSHTGDKRYSCFMCGYCTGGMGSLRRHVRTHRSENPYACDKCDYSSRHRGNLNRHKKTHAGDKRYNCYMCGYCTGDKCNLRRHVRIHTGEKPYVCDKCDYSTGDRDHLKRHKMVHTGDKPYSCDTCGYCTRDVSHLRRHVRTHTGEKPYACDKCDYSTRDLGHLKRHMGCHAADRPFSCDECGYRTGQLFNLKKHMRSHKGQKPLSNIVSQNIQNDLSNSSSTCASPADLPVKENEPKLLGEIKTEVVVQDETMTLESDPKTALSDDNDSAISSMSLPSQSYELDFKANSKLHNICNDPQSLPNKDKTVKTKKKHHMCDECDYSTGRLSNLKRHKWSHSKHKPYSCDVCDYSAGQLWTLNRHLRSHAGEKPYTCDMCGYRTGELSHLKRHVRIHTGEKPYACDKCDYSTGDPGQIRKHMWSHTNDKPYACNMCDYSAGRLGHLKKHMWSHTGGEPCASNPSQAVPGTSTDDLTTSSITDSSLAHVSAVKDESELVIDECKADIVILDSTILATNDPLTMASGDPKGTITPSSSLSQLHKPVTKISNGVRSVKKLHACDKCDYTNGRLYELKVHMRTHTGEKPYICDKCDYRTGRLGHLYRHKKVHARNKTYACAKCDYIAVQLRQLKKHMWSHTVRKQCASNIEQSQTVPGTPTDDVTTSSVTDSSLAHVSAIKDETELVLDECKSEIVAEDDTIISTDDPLIMASAEPKGIITLSSSSQSHKSAIKKSHGVKNVTKPYACDVCEYSAGHFGNLEKHRRSHAGGEPCAKYINPSQTVPGTPTDEVTTSSVTGTSLVHESAIKDESELVIDECQADIVVPEETNGLTADPLIMDSGDPKVIIMPASSSSQLHKPAIKKSDGVESVTQPYLCDDHAGHLGNLGKHKWSYTGEKLYASNINLSQTVSGTATDDLTTSSITDSSLADVSAIKDESELVIDECKAEIVAQDETIISTDDPLIMASGDPKGSPTSSSQSYKPAVKKSRGKRVTWPYTCDMCDYTNARLYELKRHMWSHSTDKPYTCDKCDYSTGRLGNMNRHLKSHTGDKPYTCDMCEYSSGQIGHLRRHVRSHTGEKPFTCEICGYGAVEIGHLKRHMWRHKSEKPYACDLCDYTAGQLGNLKRHIRSHTGESPFACDTCDFRTGRTDEFKRHKRTHATKIPKP